MDGWMDGWMPSAVRDAKRRIAERSTAHATHARRTRTTVRTHARYVHRVHFTDVCSQSCLLCLKRPLVAFDRVLGCIPSLRPVSQTRSANEMFSKDVSYQVALAGAPEALRVALLAARSFSGVRGGHLGRGHDCGGIGYGYSRYYSACYGSYLSRGGIWWRRGYRNRGG